MFSATGYSVPNVKQLQRDVRRGELYEEEDDSGCFFTEGVEFYSLSREFTKFLTLSFRRVLYVMRFLLGISPASEDVGRRGDTQKKTHYNLQSVFCTIQINQPTRRNNLSSLLLDVYLQLNMFRASSRPSSGAQFQ
jgi:hypothetical protein